MASQVSEEILKFTVKAGGDEQLTPIVRAILDLSDNSAEAQKEVGFLLKNLAETKELGATLQKYKELGAAVFELSKKYDATKLKVAELGKSLSKTDEPTKKQRAEFEKAKAELAKLGTQYDTQLEKLRGYRTELSSNGIITNNFAKAQKQLAEASGDVVDALNDMARAAKNNKDEQAALAARLAAGDEAFRRQAEASKSAREALDRVKASTNAAAQAQQEAATKTTVLGAAWTKLAAIGATLVGYLSISSAVAGVRNLLSLADASEKTRIRLAALYGSQDAGNRAFAELRKLSQETGQEFAATTEAAARLKSFGIDPLNGTLKALIDQNARAGGSQEQLSGLILATGQAWAKEKLQGEEILQLVERGVPVWDLLSKATGKNVVELQKLSEAGKLGRTEIAALIAEIGRSASGAATANLNTFGGLVTQLRDQWQQFLLTVANSGVLDSAKQQIASLLAEIKRLAADGSLAQFAQSTSNAIKAFVDVLAGGTKFVYDHGAAIAAAGKAYLEFKAIQLTLDLLSVANRWRAVAASTLAAGTAASGTGSRFSALTRTLLAVPRLLQVAVAVVGFEVLSRTAVLLGEIAAKNSDIVKAVEATAAARQKQVRDEVDALRLAQQATVEYADLQVKSALEVAKLSAAELAAYEQRLGVAREYASQQFSIALRQNEIHGATVETNAAVVEAGERIDALRAGFDNVAAGSEIAAEAMKSGIGVAAVEIAKQIGDLSGSASAAQTKIEALFSDIESVSPTRLGDIALALSQIGRESERSSENVRRGLSATLVKLSGEDLLKLQSAAQAAFEEFGISADQAATVTNAVLLTALQRLGIEGDTLGVKITDAGRDIVSTFEVVAESANATSAQIESAFQAALSSIGTSGEAQALAAALESAGARGRVSLDALSRSALALKTRLGEIEAATDPLTEAFKRLGITSQRELDRAAAAAKNAFEQISQGAKDGQAATEDVERAFSAYAEQVIAAANISSESARQQVAQQIELAGRVAGVRYELIETATASLKAGDAMEDAGNRGKESWTRVREEVQQTSTSLSEAAAVAESTAERVASAAERQAAAQRNATGAAREAVENIVVGAQQLREYEEAMARLIDRNGDFVHALSLDVVAQREVNLERERSIELVREETEAVQQAAVAGVLGSTSGGGGGSGGESAATTASTGSRTTTVELVLRNETNATSPTARLSGDQLSTIARMVLDALQRDMSSAGR